MLFIAEIGMNYNGNFDLAYELIKQSKHSGADIAKFQLGWRDGKEDINYLNFERLKQLEKWCKYFNIEFMVSIITEEAFDLAKTINFKRFKIASRTVKDNLTLVKNIVDEGKETFISLGMWDKPTLPVKGRKNVKYLWCNSKYPTTPWELTDFPKNFNDSPYEGYSDHTIGIETSLIAITRGAKVIEKHFTLDKSSTVIRDHALSATPDEFKNMTQIGRDIASKVSIGI